MTSLQLKNVDFQRSANCTAHRTNDYMTSELVVRRGQAFTVNLSFNRPVQSGDGLTMTVETGSSPSEANGTKGVMPVSTSGSRTAWSAVRGYSSGNSMTMTMNPPVTSVVGRYRMSLQMSSGGRSSSSNLGSFVLLFNPWASGDEVFMSNDRERTEYVLNEVGMYWYGNSTGFSSRRWDYGQFESDILDIVLTLLDKSSVYSSDVSLRRDPLHVGRVMSAMVNSNDNDNGVVVGRWSGDYAGGVNPTQWNGSVSILRQWKQSGPVKYGQCWVYAGVLCTVLRCLGIPTRLIINFESAHDTDRNLIVDNYYKPDGTKDDYNTDDSIWNFHAWDEFWSVRKDLGSSYDGWQIADATPQETSGGFYRLGPCSLKAVKEGDVHLNYDGPFVFSEVNADVKHWVMNPDGTSRLIYTEPKAVGALTVTKAVGSFTRADVTMDYKYPEGSPEERKVFQKAQDNMRPKVFAANARMASMSVRDDMPEEVAVKPEFKGAFKNKKAETQVGEDLTMELTLKSTAAVTRTVKVIMTATVIIYTSTPVKTILTESQTVTLGANEEKKISFLITYAQYKTALTPDNMIEVVAVCEDEKGGKLLVDKVETLKNPPLLIRVNQDAKLKKRSTVDVIFTNPIQEDVNDCSLILEGSGLMEKPQVVHVPLLKKNSRVTMEVEFDPYKVGERSFLADFSSMKFQNVKGYQSVVVAHSETPKKH